MKTINDTMPDMAIRAVYACIQEGRPSFTPTDHNHTCGELDDSSTSRMDDQVCFCVPLATHLLTRSTLQLYIEDLGELKYLFEIRYNIDPRLPLRPFPTANLGHTFTCSPQARARLQTGRRGTTHPTTAPPALASSPRATDSTPTPSPKASASRYWSPKPLAPLQPHNARGIVHRIHTPAQNTYRLQKGVCILSGQ